MTPLAMPHPGAIFGGTLFFAVGVWSIFLGLRLRYGPIPHFVSDYNGWTSVSLTLPFGGVFMLGGGVSIIGSQIPAWVNMEVYSRATPRPAKPLVRQHLRTAMNKPHGVTNTNLGEPNRCDTIILLLGDWFVGILHSFSKIPDPEMVPQGPESRDTAQRSLHHG